MASKAPQTEMSLGMHAEGIDALEKAKHELEELARETEAEIESVARTFEALTGATEMILNLAAAIVDCVENESVASVLQEVRSLGAAVKHFLGEKVQATNGILETVTREVRLLGQLSVVSRSQRAIALEIRALSILTNIEGARLSTVGTGFQYLAQELAEFSKSVTDDIQALASQTDTRKVAIEETRQVLSTELPRLQKHLGRIEGDLGSALTVVEAGLTQLATTPAQFKRYVEDIARQIAGVVAAIQVHDITRQQLEHVGQALDLIGTTMTSADNMDDGANEELPRAYAGLAIQIHQLKNIKETVGDWVSQIRMCMDGILRTSASEVVGIGPLVLEKEREVSSRLAQVEALENESQAYSERLRGTLGGLCNLMQLVTEHLQRSKTVRDRLQLLAFNSIVEASRLGTKAAAMLAIAKSIEGISAKWSQITDQSAQAMQELLQLSEHTNQVMGAFSIASNDQLREARLRTRAGLENVQAAAMFAAKQAQAMELATGRMQIKAATVGGTGDLLEACSSRLDGVRAELDAVLLELETTDPNVKKGYDPADVERLFSAFYTTAMERDVLQAALHGTPLPMAQQTFAGNSVELF